MIPKAKFYIYNMMIQFTGLSGAGKSTLAEMVKTLHENKPGSIEIFDGDVYRKTLCRDLGFSREDRHENIRRLGKAASESGSDITIIAAINPFEIIRDELKEKYQARTVWIQCPVAVLLQRDTKGLYKRAFLPDNDPGKLFNLTGINDVYEEPLHPDLVIDTSSETIEESAGKLYSFILRQWQ